MRILEFISRVFRLFGVRPRRIERPRRISLNPAGLVSFAGDVGAIIARTCPVTALYEPDLDPAAGVTIRYRVIKGPLQFPRGATEVEIKTDRNGNAAVDAVFTTRGSVIVVAELADDPIVAVFSLIANPGSLRNS